MPEHLFMSDSRHGVAFLTSYLPPTSRYGARILVSDREGKPRKYVPYEPSRQGMAEQQRAAAQSLVDALVADGELFDGTLVSAELRDGKYVHVLLHNA